MFFVVVDEHECVCLCVYFSKKKISLTLLSESEILSKIWSFVWKLSRVNVCYFGRNKYAGFKNLDSFWEIMSYNYKFKGI